MNTLEVKSVLVSFITIYCGLYYDSKALCNSHSATPVHITLFCLMIWMNAYFLLGMLRAIAPSVYFFLRKLIPRPRYRRNQVAPSVAEASVDISHNLSVSELTVTAT